VAPSHAPSKVWMQLGVGICWRLVVALIELNCQFSWPFVRNKLAISRWSLQESDQSCGLAVGLAIFIRDVAALRQRFWSTYDLSLPHYLYLFVDPFNSSATLWLPAVSLLGATGLGLTASCDFEVA